MSGGVNTRKQKWPASLLIINRKVVPSSGILEDGKQRKPLGPENGTKSHIDYDTEDLNRDDAAMVSITYEPGDSYRAACGLSHEGGR